MLEVAYKSDCSHAAHSFLGSILGLHSRDLHWARFHDSLASSYCKQVLDRDTLDIGLLPAMVGPYRGRRLPTHTDFVLSVAQVRAAWHGSLQKTVFFHLAFPEPEGQQAVHAVSLELLLETDSARGCGCVPQPSAHIPDFHFDCCRPRCSNDSRTGPSQRDDSEKQTVAVWRLFIALDHWLSALLHRVCTR